ncbi:MAG: tRNA pseudouridine(55) synthase TruB [Patescibacteria group bacterium]|nr:tRNA pseudouridine(55) synthase TruB [Patescibacteria group bacterium]
MNWKKLTSLNACDNSANTKLFNKIKTKEIVAIYKPKGWHSFRVVSFLRKKLNIKKIGFLGTLDPAAEGVLAIGLNTGTKKLKDLPRDKEYIAEIAFGLKSDTWDLETKNLRFTKFPKINKNNIEELLKQFLGKIEQPIPMFSAKQIDGTRLYKLARAGKMLKKLPTKIVQIKEVKLLKISKQNIQNHLLPTIKILVSCGPGTFIRSIAYELGQKLKTNATLISLIRTQDGGFGLKDSFRIEEL